MKRLEGPATILGGLPVFAECWFTRGDGWTQDDDCGVEGLYWLRRDGSKGKPIPQKMLDRLDKSDPYWEASVCEQVCDCYHGRQDPEPHDPERAEVFEFDTRAA